jgi:hypothetical protein
VTREAGRYRERIGRIFFTAFTVIAVIKAGGNAKD